MKSMRLFLFLVVIALLAVPGVNAAVQVVASNTIQYSNASVTASSAGVEWHNITLDSNTSGTINLSVQLKAFNPYTDICAAPATAYYQFFADGVELGTEQSTTSLAFVWLNQTGVAVSNLKNLSLRVWASGTGSDDDLCISPPPSGTHADSENFMMMYDYYFDSVSEVGGTGYDWAQGTMSTVSWDRGLNNTLWGGTQYYHSFTQNCNDWDTSDGSGTFVCNSGGYWQQTNNAATLMRIVANGTQNITNGDLKTIIEWSSVGTANASASGLISRYTNSSNYYRGIWNDGASDVNYLQYTNVGGNSTSSGSMVVTNTYRLRLLMNDSYSAFKWWKVGDSEPEWTNTLVNSSYILPGKWGYLLHRWAANLDTFWIRSVQSNGNLYTGGNYTYPIYNISSLKYLSAIRLNYSNTSQGIGIYINTSSDNVSWSGEHILIPTAINNFWHYVNASDNVNFVRVRLQWNDSVSEPDARITNISYGELALSSPNITQTWSSVHGFDNSSVAIKQAPININFNVTATNYSTITWKLNGVQVQSGTSLTYNHTFHLAPEAYNLTAQAFNGGLNSNISYWLINSSEKPYQGSTPTDLLRLQRPIKNQLQYIYGSNTYFYNATNWTVNGTQLECITSCGIATSPLKFWVRPIDGIVTIMTQKITGGATAATVFVNNTNLGSYNLSGSGDYNITITGLNPNNISYFYIGDSLGEDMVIYGIKYNRSYPALYDGTDYFQIKRVYYETGTNNTGMDDQDSYFGYNNSVYIQDLTEIKATGFNQIAYPLIWGYVVSDVRRNTNGTSNNLYNQTTLQLLDHIIDNASEQGIYVTLWLNQWDINFNLPAGVKLTDNTYPCANCLINQTSRDSMKQLFIFLSNRYKNHTNINFNFAFESFDGDYADAGWYDDAENVAAWQAHSGYGDSSLPHAAGSGQEKYDSLFKWQQDNLWSLIDSFLPTLHANGHLLDVNIYPYRWGQNAVYTVPSVRVGTNISDIDYIGHSDYPSVDNFTEPIYYDTLENIVEDSYKYASWTKSWGGIQYLAEAGINTNRTYQAGEANIIDGSFRNIIVNVQDTNYDDKNTSYGLAGLVWWEWKEVSRCRVDWQNDCWGVKFKNDTYVPWYASIQAMLTSFNASSYSPESPISTEYLTSQTFIINMTREANLITWYINGTQVQQNVSVTNASYNNGSAGIGSYLVLASAYDGIDYINVSWIWNVAIIPPASMTNPQTTTGNFFINNTWVNPVDADFNHTMFKYVNGTILQNVSTTFLNLTWSPHYEQNISAQTVDTSGNINGTKVWFNATIPNNVPILTSIGAKSATLGEYLNFTVSATDADSDTLTYGTNASNGTLNTTTGEFTWLTDSTGTFYWYFNASEAYSGLDSETISVTVSEGEYMPSTPINCVSTVGTNWMNFSCSATGTNTTDSFNKSLNGQWDNTSTNWMNVSGLDEGTLYEGRSYSYNSSGNGSLNLTYASETNTTATTPPPADTNTTPSLTSVTNSTCLAHSCVVSFDVNQSNAKTMVKYGLNTSLLQNTTNQTSGTSRTDNLTGLTNNTKYYYSVFAWNSSNASYNTNSTTQNFTTAEDYVPPETPAAPAITSYTPASLTPTVDVNELATFTATANQSVTWDAWSGATELSENGTYTSATQTWTTTGAKTVIIDCSNANGSCTPIQWDVIVVSDGSGGSGINWDWLSGTISPSGATLTTNASPNTCSVVGTTYSCGYDFVDGNSYWVNFAKAGYTSNNTTILFNEDHEILNVTLYSTELITSVTPATNTHYPKGTSVNYSLTTLYPVTYNWSESGVSVSTDPYYIQTYTTIGSKLMRVEVTDGANSSSYDWQILITRNMATSANITQNLDRTWFQQLIAAIRGT